MAETKGTASEIQQAKSAVQDTTNKLGSAAEEKTGTTIDAQALSDMSGTMSFNDALDIMQILNSMSSNNTPQNARAVAKMLDEKASKYGPDAIEQADTLYKKMMISAAKTKTESVYGLAKEYSKAALFNDPTWTTTAQAQIAEMSQGTVEGATKLYKDRKTELDASKPQFTPLSNDPDMNQMFLGMAMQGAAGLLALLDPEAASVAASQIGATTIDAMYDRKLRIDGTNKELQKKYMELMSDHTKRDDALFKDYFDGVMKERGELKNTMRELINNEYDNTIKRMDNRIKAEKERIDAAYKAGQLTQKEHEMKVDALSKKADIDFKIWQEYMKEKNDDKRLWFLYSQLAQQQSNELLKWYMPSMNYKNPRTIAAVGPNTYALRGMDRNRAGYNVNEFLSAQTESGDEQIAIQEEYKDDLDAIMATDDPALKATLVDALEKRIAADYRSYRPPEYLVREGKDSNKYLGYMAGITGTYGKLHEDIANMKDNLGKKSVELYNRKEATAYAAELRKQGASGQSFDEKFLLKYPDPKFLEEIKSQMAGD